MTQLRILAITKRGAEFATADAINDMGGMAVVPRQVTIIPAKGDQPARYDYRPFLPNYLFLSLTEAQWYQCRQDRLFIAREGVRTILPEFRRVLDILPATWADFQGFADRAEMACNLRIEQFETGLRVARYRPGDRLRIVGDLLDGQLRDRLARFVRMDGGKVIAEVDGMTMLGKPVTARLDGWDVEGIAAE